MRTLIGILRLFIYGLTCVLLIPVQALIVTLTKGPAAYLIPRFFHRFNLRLFNIAVDVVGAPARTRHIIFVSNHLSYLDIEVISAVIDTSFVAKADVAQWPLFGILAKLQQTVFISRDPRKREEASTAFGNALSRAMPLVLFAEGTSSNGQSVLPFKSTLFGQLLDKKLIIQPMTLDLVEVDGQSTSTPSQRDLYAYYGDIVLAPHLWQFAKSRGAKLRVVFHAPIETQAYADRKTLALAAHTACAAGLQFAKHEAEPVQ